MPMIAYSDNSLATIDDGHVPETRLKDPTSCQNYARRLIDNDEKRAYKRGRVNGLVDGNPPYRLSKLREAGRADACNVNWGIARAYMESGNGAFYDLFSEAPGFFGIRTGYGTPEQRDEWSAVMREEADCVITDGRNEDGEQSDWDYEMQQSQWDMVLHGCGPLMFEDSYAVLPRAFHCGDLKVPEFTKSSTKYWDGCMIQAKYYPPELYRFIENPEAADAIGWNVEYTKEVIANAMDIRIEGGLRYDWELYQQELKNNSLNYYDDSKVCWIAHVFWKEFDGRITHVMVPRDDVAGVETKFLFQKIGRYKNWRQCIHPMYFDRGNGGYHHSVTGLGVKMYGAMEYQNRLICNLSDKAFAPKILFKPTTTEASQRFSLAHFGDYAVLPSNFEWAQTGVAGLSNEGIAMNKLVTDLMQSNLSQYRQQIPAQESGNPPTKYQKQLEASQQSSLSKTTFNRYYKQMDQLYQEIARRLFNLNSTDPRATACQERCRKRGVPDEAMSRLERVEAIRVIGQGSAFMRKQAVDSLLPLAGALPEDGRDRLIEDKIAAEAGQAAVHRYYPRKLTSKMADDQHERANNQVADMKVGVPPIITPSQNAVTFAQTFLKAGAQALASLQQGADPHEVLSFLELDGPAAGAQIQRFENDPTRAEMVKTMTEQWHKLAELTDKLKQQIQQQMQQAQGQQQKTQKAMSDQQLRTAKVASDIKLKQVKLQAQLQQSAQKHKMKLTQDQQSMALEDAKTAAEIQRNRLKSLNGPRTTAS